MIVAGIIVFAVGMKVTIADVGGTLSDAGRLALCGGLALYLAGNVAFRLRLVRRFTWAPLAGAVVLLALFALGGDLSALWITALAAGAVTAVCAVETLGRADQRPRGV